METKMAYGNSKLNRDVIKYIAMLTMLLNHISQVFMKSGYFLSELFLDNVLLSCRGLSIYSFKKELCY